MKIFKKEVSISAVIFSIVYVIITALVLLSYTTGILWEPFSEGFVAGIKKGITLAVLFIVVALVCLAWYHAGCILYRFPLLLKELCTSFKIHKND